MTITVHTLFSQKINPDISEFNFHQMFNTVSPFSLGFNANQSRRTFHKFVENKPVQVFSKAKFVQGKRKIFLPEI